MTAPRWNIGEGWDGFARLWFEIGAHAKVYGWAPKYQRAVDFVLFGGFMSAAQRAMKEKP